MDEIDKLKKLRVPFDENQISKLPKPSRKQTEEVKSNYLQGMRCKQCGGWHHPGVIHLDYVGHAAITDRLLDVDPTWNWEPLSLNEAGQPVYDNSGGMWIKLTICGVTRLGYGNADGKTGGNAIKEVIGDAIRNAAMRFGAALYLWHKGELHNEHEQKDESTTNEVSQQKEIEDSNILPEVTKEIIDAQVPRWKKLIKDKKKTVDEQIAQIKAYGSLSDELEIEIRESLNENS